MRRSRKTSEINKTIKIKIIFLKNKLKLLKRPEPQNWNLTRKSQGKKCLSRYTSSSYNTRDSINVFVAAINILRHEVESEDHEISFIEESLRSYLRTQCAAVIT